MRRLLIPLLAAVLALALAAPALAARNRGVFQLEFETPATANRALVETLERSGGLQRIVDEVNRRWALPRNVPIVVTDDLPRDLADNGPAYYPSLPLQNGRRIPIILFPADFLALERRALARELRGVRGLDPTVATIEATEFVVAHEIGHALVSQLRLPVTGREEDAVDGFAAFLTVDNPRFGPFAALSAAGFFDALGQRRLVAEDFADEHSLPRQRAYQFLCWAYGSDPRGMRAIVGPNGLPRARAQRCGEEWRHLRYAWSTLLRPYARSR